MITVWLLATALVSSSSATAATPRASLVGQVAPLPNTTLTRRGWSPIGLGAVQISVPSDWFVEDPGLVCSQGDSMVFIDQKPYAPPKEMGCTAPINAVELSTATRAALPSPRRVLVNSIPVYESATGSGSKETEIVRALGIQLSVAGPLSARVVATLTHSPYSVVLGSSVRSVPAGWRHVAFGGIRFAVPGRWAIERNASWGGCPYNIQGDELELSTAQVFSAPGCPAPFETAGYLAAHPGMVFGSGPQVPHAPRDAHCLQRNHLRICIDRPPPPVGGLAPGHELNLLTAQITVPKQVAIDQIEIGLTGNGLTPLQIFDSIQPAR
jgi:hypothetical protein